MQDIAAVYYYSKFIWSSLSSRLNTGHFSDASLLFKGGASEADNRSSIPIQARAKYTDCEDTEYLPPKKIRSSGRRDPVMVQED